MCVKGNQKKLYEGLQAIVQEHTHTELSVSCQQGHGRLEHRIVALYDQVDAWQTQWPGLARLLCVYRCGERNHKRYAEVHYYITDLCETAQALAELVRGHWSIENQLHWPKDVVLGEDNARHRSGNSPANWSFVRNIFINLARKSGFTSITKAKRFFANRPRDVLLALT